MTPFERASIALLHHCFVYKVRENQGLERTRLKVTRPVGSIERPYTIKEISWDRIDIECERDEERYQVYNEGYPSPDRTVVKTEDRPHYKIQISNINKTSMTGSILGSHFRSTITGPNKVEIRDDERNKSFTYYIGN